MPFYEIDQSQQKLQRLSPSNFVNEKWWERQHLQPVLRDNPEVIDPGLFIISEEFSNWEDSKRRIDLLGLDEEGNLVVIEIKRVEDAGHLELQSIRYAAMVSAMNFEDVVKDHEQLLSKSGKDCKKAELEIKRFLDIKNHDSCVRERTLQVGCCKNHDSCVRERTLQVGCCPASKKPVVHAYN